MYAHMVTKITDKIYQNANKDLFHKCLQTQPHPDSPIVVCKTCKGYLQRNKMPPQCQANNLQLDSIPEELNNLCDLECQLISKRIPFMKIVNLQRAAQKGIKGAVVNVPTDLSKVCAFLPRTMSDSGIVAVNLKRQLHYTGHVNYQIVRPESLYKAIEYLRKQ